MGSCPTCGMPSPAAARFCPNCGGTLATETAQDVERRSRLSAAVPAPLASKMRASSASGERRPVTILFSDVVGSTAIGEKMDPEDWTVIVNEAFDRMTKAIHRYEGTIARLMGDAILAFFGAPVAHEDDPERAVRAALDMVASIEDYGRQLKAAQGIEFRIRAGISTGDVVVGNVGTDLMYEYTAMGDAVNVAARVEAAAPPGSVLITASTHRFIAPLFDVVALEPLAVKGKAEPVQTYEIVGIKAVPGRVRGLIGLESPMVGRDHYLAQLLGVVDIVRAGSGRVACIIGDPGLGKTRLIAELRAATLAADQRPAWFEGRCLSYGQGLPYHLLLDLVHSLIGVPVAASEADTRAALHSRLDDLLGVAAGDPYAYLAHLLSLRLEPDASARVADLEPGTLQGRYVAAMTQVLRAASARGPQVMVCEDVHWADSSSVDVLGMLLALVHELPILLVATTRAERSAPGWRLVTTAEQVFGETLTEILLAPLTGDESRQLVGNLLEIESLPTRVREFILAKAEGNPLFVEEVIRMLIDRGAIVRSGDQWAATKVVEDVEIPDTLHGLLLARIDRLPPDARRTLRVASVIGRQFSVRVLERLLAASA